MRDITAAVVEKRGGPFLLRRMRLAEPRANEVLVRIVSSGLCNTDLAVRAQTFPAPLPMVLGHEGSGVVEEVGAEVETVGPGDHVVLSFAFCGTCPTCSTGRPNACRHGRRLNFAGTRHDGSTTLSMDGRPIGGQFFGQSSFAEYAVVRASAVVPVPDDVDLRRVGPLGCSIATGAGAVLNTLGVAAGSSLAVFGVGSVGLAAVLAGVAAGATTIIAVDRAPARLARAVDLGATRTVDNTDTEAHLLLASLAGAVDYVVETTGHPSVIPAAIATTSVGGACALAGFSPIGTRVSLDVNTLALGRTVLGCVEGDAVPSVFIPRLLRLHRAGRFPFEEMITLFPFAELDHVADLATRGAVIKPVLVMD
jgi:aryl-alcohol dehydrogenase